MKTKKKLVCGFLAVIFALAFTATAFAQTEADFNVTLTADGEGVVIAGYTGKTAAVRIPATIQGMPVREIGGSAFYRNATITSVVIPQGVLTINGRGNGAFKQCQNLTSVSIPAGLTTIGACAFEDCEKLTSVNIPEGVTDIQERAFGGCSSLKEIKLPESVKMIGSAAFASTAISTFTFPKNVIFERELNLFLYCKNLKTVTLPANLTFIGESWFWGCEALTAITLPEGIKSIGENAFYQSGLTAVTLPASIQEIGGNAFARCPNLTAVTIPDSVASIIFLTGRFGIGRANAFQGSGKLNLASQAALKKRGYTGSF